MQSRENQNPDALQVRKALAPVMQLLQQGALAQAEQALTRLLARWPTDPEILHLHGMVVFQRGDLDTTIAQVSRAVAALPSSDVYAGNLAVVLRASNRLDQAIAAGWRAAALAPGVPETHLNLGNALEQLGRLDAAIAAFRRALDIRPEADIYLNLGIALWQAGDPAPAIEALGQAVRRQANNPKAHSALGQIFLLSGNPAGAIQHLKQSCRLTPGDAPAWQRFAMALSRLDPAQVDRDILRDILQCFALTTIDRQCLGTVTAALLKRSDTLRPLILAVRSGVPLPIAHDELARRLAAPLFLSLLETTIVTDWELALFLEELRRHALARVSPSTDRPAWTAQELRLWTALGMQSFANEYVSHVTAEEADRVAALRQRVLAADAGTAPNIADLIVLSQFKPLYRLEMLAERLAPLLSGAPDHVKSLIARQIHEPNTERGIAATVRALTLIDDRTSLAVQEQYEDSPYPRYLDVARQRADNLDAFLRDEISGFASTAMSVKADPDILVAGCGTGRPAFAMADRIPAARILAVDLSRASLAHAIRHARRCGLGRIDFAQADILRLGEIGRRFDAIDVAGVLHHLREPIAGIRVLAGLLRSGGFMRLGLYSRIARRHVSAVRQLLATESFQPTVQGIREARRRLHALPADSPLRAILGYPDFHTLSNCRDLLFHVEEHCFDLDEIERIANELELEILGLCFDDLAIKRQFREANPDPLASRSIAAWRRFEQANPDAFIGMYQFWVTRH